MQRVLKNALNIFLFGIVVILSLIDYIELNSIIYPILIVVFFSVFLKGKQYLKSGTSQNNLFNMLIYKYVGIIYILMGAIIWCKLKLNTSNISTFVFAFIGIVIMLFPDFRTLYQNKNWRL